MTKHLKRIKRSYNIVGRGFITPFFMKTLPYIGCPLFQILSCPPYPIVSLPNYVILYICANLLKILLRSWHLPPPPPPPPQPPFFIQKNQQLSLQTVQAPLFFRQLPLYISFSCPLPPKNWFWTPIIVKLFILNPISQFKFFAMTEKSIFVYKLFCHEIFQILVYFLCETCNPPPPLKQKRQLHTVALAF